MTATLLEPPRGRLTRRRFLAASAGAGLLTACGTGPEAPSAGEAWSFTDDLGVRVERPARPQRVVAYDTAAAALWHLGIVPAGIFSGSRLAESVSLRGFDLTRTTAVGETYGQVDLEAVAALRPDLVVTAFDPRQQGPLFGFADEAMQERARSIAPIVAIDGIRDPLDVVARFEDLARALGVEPPAAPRDRFTAAATDLTAALTAKPGLTAVALTTYEQQVYFARPEQFPGLRQLRGLGLRLVEPGSTPADVNDDFVGFFWEKAGFELAGKYPADLVLYDPDPSALQPPDLARIPTLAALPAVRAGQFAPWRKLEDWSHASYTADVTAILTAVRAADPTLAP